MHKLFSILGLFSFISVFSITGRAIEGRHQMVYVPVVKATPEALKGYGHIVVDKDSAEIDIVTWPAQGWRNIASGTGNKAGTTKGIVKTRWDGNYCYATYQDIEYLIGWSTYPDDAQKGVIAPRKIIVTHEVDYHPDGGQFVYPLDNKPFVLVLALPGDNVSPQDFVAFYFDGIAGFHIDPGVWHQLPFPLEDTLELYNEQGAVFACVDCEFIPEFDCLLAIDLNFYFELKKK